MSTYSTASHVRHPWFDRTIMKRKHPVPLDPTADMDDEDDVETRTTKRRRCTMLENGIAQLSLGRGHSWVVEEAASPTLATGVSFSGDRQNIVLPDSVEEPPAPEIKMGTSTWYEPERDRIVITDLDGYADSEEDGGLERGVLNVNSALLDQFRAYCLPKAPVPETRALVVFRPLGYKERDEDAMDLDT